MPATLEIKCTNEDYRLDMFKLYYTYDMPGDVAVTDFSCPYCGGSCALEEIQL